MTDDKLKPRRGRKPKNPALDDTARAVSSEDDKGVDETLDGSEFLPQASKGPPSFEDVSVDATLPVVRRPPPGVENVAVDATLPAVAKVPPRPGDLGVASTLPVGGLPAQLKNVGLKVTLSKGKAMATPLVATPVETDTAGEAKGADEAVALNETLEIYAPEQVADPLAKMLGVPDGLVNPDAAMELPLDPAAAAKAEYAQRYELRDEVGRGGIGRVVLAFDPRLGREVALKELLPRFASGKSVGVGTTPDAGSSRSPAEVRFLDEARITAQLEHPGIVPVHELGQRADGSIYYAMRMVRGRDMKKALKGRGLRERLELIPNYLELCHAMAYAHSRGVMHRDLKPDNVMLGEFGETVVLDWGLAKVRGKKDRRMEALADEMEQLRKSSGTETVMGAPLGTPAYMPPEQAAGQLELIDERSDVYSLGAILYEVLTGRAPHSGDSALAVLDMVQSEDIVPPEQREAEVPPELSAICQRALAKRREERYETAKLLAEDVRRFQVGGLVRAHDYSLWDLTRRWLKRHRTALVVVVALLAVAGGMWQYRGYTEKSRRARAERNRQAQVKGELEKILVDVARGPKVKNWLDVYTFKLIALKEPLVERRLLQELGHPKVAVRQLVARSLGGMKSLGAVDPLCARLKKGVEPSETVVIAVINALGIIGHSRANEPVSRARFRHGQFGAVWRNTKLAFRMIPLPPLPKTGVTANLLVDRGRDTANKGDRAGAIALYTRAMKLDPKLTRAYVNRAIERKVLGDVSGALADYGRAIQLNPKDVASYNNRAYILRSQGKYAAALADLNRVVASPKYRVLGLSARAVVYRHMGRADDALRDYRAAFAAQPDRASIPYNMAFVWADKGDLVRVLDSLGKALKIQPSYTRALVARSSVLLHRGDFAGALVDAERAVSLDPAYKPAYTARGRVLLARGRLKASQADFDKGVALSKKRSAYRGVRAVFFHAVRGRYDLAKTDLARALKLARSEEEARGYRILLIAIAVRAGDMVGARKQLAGAVVLDTKAPKKRAGAILYLRGELSEAALQKAVPFYRRVGQRGESYMAFLRGLKAELAGTLPLAVKAYTTATRILRWSTPWYALARQSLKVLRVATTTAPQGPGPGKAQPRRVVPLRKAPPPSP